MKKLVIIIMLCAVWVTVAGQTYDTIYNRAINGYYYKWYDECDVFYNNPYSTSNITLINFNRRSHDSTSITLASKYTPVPMTIRGGIVMEFIEPREGPWQYERAKPEYLLLYQRDEVLDTMILIDSARWDTVTPKIMKLPRGADTARYGFKYCYGYEVRFKSPVTVDSTFYMGGTQNNNVWIERGDYAVGGYLGGYYKYRPVQYCRVTLRSRDCTGDTAWVYGPMMDTTDYTFSNGWHRSAGYPGDSDYGGVIPIVDTFRLEVATSDSLQGQVSGGGTYTNMSLCTISATAVAGYRFTHWSDNNSDNPRQVLLTQDTHLTAYFVELEQVWADVRSSDDSRGTVTGGGVYYEGDTATLLATALPGNKFLCWNDSVRDNPRQVEMTRDTTFIALFGPKRQCNVEARANNSDRGRVEGGGVYYEEDTVTLTALPWMTFGFLRWEDGDTTNPRQFEVVQDTVFTAIFVSRDEIEDVSASGSGLRLLPNPTSGSVVCVVDGEASEGGVLTVTDVAGREVLRKELPPLTTVHTLQLTSYPKGVYYVTLTTAKGSTTQKLVVE